MSPAAPHVDSYYAASAIGACDYPSLQCNISCDVCVIGGGFTGLSSAYHLAARGYGVVLLEANKIGWGASGRNGGQLGSGQRHDQIALEQMVGRDWAKRLWELAEDAKATAKDLIDKHAIPCDLRLGIVEAAWKPKHFEEEKRYADLLRQHYDYHDRTVIEPEELPNYLGTDVYHGGTLDKGAGHLHPLNFALGLARAAEDSGVRLFEHSRVIEYDRARETTVRTAEGQVRAKFVVLACNGYLEKLEPRVAGKIMPINNFILATEPLDQHTKESIIRGDYAAHDTKFVVNYYRFSADRRFLFGGGETYRRTFPADLKSFIRKYMLQIFPRLDDVRIDYAWGGTLAITLNRLPHFGRLEPNVFIAQGYSGHGVALTILAGKLIAEAVSGTAERFDVMANLPLPTFPGGTLLRWPGLVAGMLYYSLRDRLG